jgi:hypothetical protein
MTERTARDRTAQRNEPRDGDDATPKVGSA